MKTDSVLAGAHARAKAAEWRTRPERGSKTLLRIMAGASRLLGRSTSRIFVYLIAAYFFLFAPTARRHARTYLRRALNREPTPADRFRQILSFASTIHDRVYLLNERFDLFDISMDGEEQVRVALASGKGGFLIGAHMGSFEVTSAIGRHRPGIEVVMAMYADNARKITTLLDAIRPAVKPEIVPLGHIEAMLKIRDRLDEGAFVGIMGDRTLGAEPLQKVTFLGASAYFPVGPMRAAALLRRPIIFMLGLYRGANRYHVVFEHVADFSAVGPAQRAAAVERAITRYVALLEKYCRSDPYNWFNFFDFWRDSDPRPARPP